MLIKTGTSGRQFMGRLEHGSDLLESLSELVQGQGVKAGTISVIGAVQKARVGFFNQKTREYKVIELPEELEIINCTGNVSIKEGKPFVHAHVVLGDEGGNTYGGHLQEGTIVYAAEYSLVELEGIFLEREFDQATSLTLWQE